MSNVGIAVSADGSILVADFDAFGGRPGGIIRVDPTTGSQTKVSSGGYFTAPVGLAIAANGDIIVANAAGGGPGASGIIRVDPATGGQTIVSVDGNFVAAFDVAIVPAAKDDCKDGGWSTFKFPRTFKNQGDCVQFMETGK